LISKKYIHVVAAIIRNDNSEYLITQRLPNAHHAGLWEFPGGTIESGETPEVALLREIREELDVIISVGDFFWREVFNDGNKIIDIAFYNCYLKPKHQIIKLNGIADYRWIKKNEFTRFEFPEADFALIEQLMNKKKIKQD